MVLVDQWAMAYSGVYVSWAIQFYQYPEMWGFDTRDWVYYRY
jgi:hypothetical protein